VRIIRLDGSAAAVDGLAAALADALRGGPAVLPLGHDAPVPAAGASAPGPPPGTVLVATSGSTGTRRLVVLPAAALRASAAATAARLGGPARWLLALPADHVGGVQVVVRAVLAGTPPTTRPGGFVAQDLRGGFRPDGFAAATAALGPGRRCTSLVPTQLLRLLDAGGAALEALRGYAAVLVGGAALHPGLRGRAEAAGVRVVATYGSTETAGGCVYDGVPLDGVRVRLDGDGRIVLGGPTLAAGYLGRPAETAAAFGVDEHGDREFRTGDLGRWADGRLEVLGRADDMIVTGGEKVAPAAVERVLAAQPGVREACVVGLPDVEWGAVVAAAVVVANAGEDAADPQRWRAAVRAALGRAAVPRVLHVVDALPLRGIGKPDRAAIARLLAAVSPPRRAV
jgi:O-succinylbenzoic acid--CoA ligase